MRSTRPLHLFTSLAIGLIGAVALRSASTALHADAAGPTTPVSLSETAQAQTKPWTMNDLLPVIADLGTGRDWAKGREVFQKAACGGCHAFGRESEGTGLAPDITAVGSRYTRDFILQSILEPSATLNGQFFFTTFTLKDGRTVTGSVIDTVDKKILVAPVMLTPTVTVEVLQADIKSEAPSDVSPMPPGLLDGLTKEQIVELFAFLDAGGDRNAAIYRKK